MLPLVYIGLISFFGSFSISHFFTQEYLRYKYQINIDDNLKSLLNSNNDNNPKSKSLVKFNDDIDVKYIPSITDISSNTLSELWYDNDDYKRFKLEYLWYNKYFSI